MTLTLPTAAFDQISAVHHPPISPKIFLPLLLYIYLPVLCNNNQYLATILVPFHVKPPVTFFFWGQGLPLHLSLHFLPIKALRKQTSYSVLNIGYGHDACQIRQISFQYLFDLKCQLSDIYYAKMPIEYARDTSKIWWALKDYFFFKSIQ